MDLDRAIHHHFCDFKRASCIGQGQDLGIVVPFVRLEHKENLVSNFIFMLQSFHFLFCVVFKCLPGRLLANFPANASFGCEVGQSIK